MDKKWKVIILIFCIIICIGVYTFQDMFNINNQFQVGSTNFNLPDGYTIGNSNSFGAVNITNGKYAIFGVEYNDSNITKHIQDYNNFLKNDKNQTLHISNFTVEDVLIHKSYNVDTPNNSHYWFVKNGKTYEFYKWDENPSMDFIVSEFAK